MAILRIPPFAALYERFTDVRLPARAVLIDALKELQVRSDAAEEGVDTFIVNLRFVGLLQTLSGAERIVGVDHLLDALPVTAVASQVLNELPSEGSLAVSRSISTSEPGDPFASGEAEFETTCFYIAPIGEEDSEQRRHSDLFLANIVEPALATFKLSVVRADRIGKSGMITRQVIEYLLRSRLVIADRSFHNPNVFYELALSHAVRLPIVQLIRAEDRLPFDIHQMRTVVIDNRDIYSLVPKLETYRSEIANQVRRALEAAAEADTPISVFFPSFKVSI